MLHITNMQSEALKDVGLSAFYYRLEPWLLRCSAGWRNHPVPARRESGLALLRLGNASGLEFETHLATFAWMMTAKTPDWRILAQKREIAAVLDARDWDPEGKLIALYDLVQPPDFQESL